MYESFYGLTEPPFNLTPDSKYLFLSRRHREALAALLFGIRERKGFLCLTGEIGSGKTMICRSLINEIREEKTRTAYVFNSFLSDLELLQTINDEFGLESKSASKKELIDHLNHFLIEQTRSGGNAVLIVDEAQNLPIGTLEQVRMLGNLESETMKLLQTLLVGQPELGELLAREELEQLNQRVAVRYHIAPLDEEETLHYIRHRLLIAQNKTHIEIPYDALQKIHRFSRGVPRKINVLCDRLLLMGYVEESTVFDGALVDRAIEEVQGPAPSPPKRRPWAPGLALKGSLPVEERVRLVKYGIGALALASVAVIAIALALGPPFSDPANKMREYDDPPAVGAVGSNPSDFTQILAGPAISPTATPRAPGADIVAPSQAMTPAGPGKSIEASQTLGTVQTMSVAPPTPVASLQPASSPAAKGTPKPTASPQSKPAKTSSPTPKPRETKPAPSPTPKVSPTPSLNKSGASEPSPKPAPLIDLPEGIKNKTGSTGRSAIVPPAQPLNAKEEAIDIAEPPPPAPLATVAPARTSAPGAIDTPVPASRPATPEPDVTPMTRISPSAGNWVYDNDNIVRVKDSGQSMAASVLTAARRWGMSVDLSPFRAYGAKQMKSLDMISEARKQLNMRVFNVGSDINSAIRLDLPAIVTLARPREGESETQTAVALHGTKLALADPVGGLREVSLADLQPRIGEILVPYRDPDNLQDLKPGDQNDRVLRLKKFLDERGWLDGEPTDVYDESMTNGVRRMQAYFHLPQSGTLDEWTSVIVASRRMADRPRLAPSASR